MPMPVPRLAAATAAALLYAAVMALLPGAAVGFTDGRLLPPSFCGLVRVPSDPTTLGQYINNFYLAINAGPAPQIMDGILKICGRPLDAPAGSVLETQRLFALFHSYNNVQSSQVIKDVQNPIQIAVRGYLATDKSTTLTAVPQGKLYRGKLHAFYVQATPNGVFDVKTRIAGAVIYASTSTSDLDRVGSFTNTGPGMAVWPFCGIGNVGVVHTPLMGNPRDTTTGSYPADLSETSPAPISAGLIWRAPTGVRYPVGKTVVFKGHGVMDLGFGPFSQTFTLADPPPSTG